MRISDWSSDVCASDLAGVDGVSLNGGADVFGGDALTIENGAGATATANNTADGIGAVAGDDHVLAGEGNDMGGGEAAEISLAEANATANNHATNSGSAGNDTINGAGGNDTLSGGAFASGVTGAIATVLNDAATGGTAGGDSITAGDGNDDVAGDAWAKATSGTILADVDTPAGTGGSAGDDVLTPGAKPHTNHGEAHARRANTNALHTPTANTT